MTKEFEEILKLDKITQKKIDNWLNTWPCGGVSSLGIAMRFNMDEYEVWHNLLNQIKEV